MPTIPKPPAMRARRNKVSTKAVLEDVETARLTPPELPDGRDWHQLTVGWWQDIWRSPMAPEFLQADVHGLILLADLVNRYWLEPSTALAAEIRLQRQCFGLTPIDRRRLQWEVKRVEAADKKRPAAPAAPVKDPRALLTVV